MKGGRCNYDTLFSLQFRSCLQKKRKGEGPQRKCTDNPQMVPPMVGSVQARGNICDVI